MTEMDKLLLFSSKDNLKKMNQTKIVKLIENLEKENEELIAENKALAEENNILVKGLGCETCSIHLEYENLNNQIAELKAQIEKMKCCGNCKNKKRNTTCSFCYKKDKWDLAE